MDKLLVTIVVAYVFSSCYFLIDCFKLFKKDDPLSPEEIFLSLIVLLIVTIFGFLLIPIYSIQALKDKKLELGNVMPLVVIFLVSLLTVSSLTAFIGTVL